MNKNQPMPSKMKEWAEKMGYVDTTNAFENLCRNPKMAALWSDVMSKVKSKKEVNHIRKNIVVQRMKNGSSHRQQVSGVLGQQLQSHQELEQLRLQKEKALDGVSSCENSIKETRNNIYKKALQKNLLENQIHDAQIKQRMFKLKKKECESFLSWLQKVNILAKSHFPPQSTKNDEDGKRHATAILKKCISAVKEFQLWKIEEENKICPTGLEDFQSNYQLKKASLWHAISAFVAKIPPDYVWSAILDHVEESVTEMCSLASKIDEKPVNEISGIGTSLQPDKKLVAMHVKALEDVMENLLKAEHLTRRFELLIEETVDDIKIKKASTDANSSLVKMPSKKLMEYFREYCRSIQLKATKKCLQEGIEEIKRKSGNLFSSQNLQKGRATLARLDNEIEEAKRHVEQLFKSVKDTAGTFRNVQKSVEEELEKFPKNLSSGSNSLGSDSSGDIPSSNISHVSSTAVIPFASSTPATWAAKRGGSSRLSFCDVSTVLCDSGEGNLTIASSDKNLSHLREVVPVLKNSVSQESKTLMKLPLDLADKNKLPLPVLFSSHLEAPSVIARTSNKRFAQLLQLLHGVDESQVYLSLFRDLGHLRGAQIQQLLGIAPPPTPLCADISLQFFEITSRELYSVLRDRLKNAQVVLESTEHQLEEAKTNHGAWFEQPLQKLIPANIQHHGMNFEQWLENYNSFVARKP